MHPIEIFAVITALIAIGAWLLYVQGTPFPYRARSCAGKDWRRAFPDSDKDHIRRFLSCFADAMAFSEASKLKFRPCDRLIDVYESIYGRGWVFGDSFELEQFFLNLGHTFNVSTTALFDDFDADATLGEVYSAVRPVQHA